MEDPTKSKLKKQVSFNEALNEEFTISRPTTPENATKHPSSPPWAPARKTPIIIMKRTRKELAKILF